MRVINPRVDKMIDFIKSKINIKVLKAIVLIIIILLIINCVVSGIAINLYLMRQSVQNNLDIPNKERTIEQYNQIYSNEKKKAFIEKYFGDKTMVLAYPNLTITLNDGTVVRVREYLPDIQPYYYKFIK